MAKTFKEYMEKDFHLEHIASPLKNTERVKPLRRRHELENVDERPWLTLEIDYGED